MLLPCTPSPGRLSVLGTVAAVPYKLQLQRPLHHNPARMAAHHHLPHLSSPPLRLPPEGRDDMAPSCASPSALALTSGTRVRRWTHDRIRLFYSAHPGCASNWLKSLGLSGFAAGQPPAGADAAAAAGGACPSRAAPLVDRRRVLVVAPRAARARRGVPSCRRPAPRHRQSAAAVPTSRVYAFLSLPSLPSTSTVGFC